MGMRYWLAIAASLALVGSVGGLALASDTAAVSPDGSLQAFIEQIGKGDEDGSGAQALKLVNKRTGEKQTLLVSTYNGDHRLNLTGLGTPLFSLEGGYLYINSSDASPYRSAVHQVNLQTGAVRFITGGWAISVIRTGPYRGYLLVQKHLMYEPPRLGTYNPVFVIRPDGYRQMIVPGSENDDGELAVGPWLAKQGWHAW
jgi:hypothetical protein